MGVVSPPAFRLVIPGPPQGQGRARIGRTKDGQAVAYTPARTRSYAVQIHQEWIAQGRPTVPEGPYRLVVRVAHERPPSHFRKDGHSLSAVGRRTLCPGKPDLDNVVKGVLDALCSVGAIPDDRHLVELSAWKFWATPDGGGGARVEVDAVAVTESNWEPVE